jgi:hypothetical protein
MTALLVNRRPAIRLSSVDKAVMKMRPFDCRLTSPWGD